MPEFKGTPGDWQVDRTGYLLKITSQNPFDIVVGSIGHEDTSEEIIEANAQLMAAAPELLNALQDLMNHYQTKGQLLTWDVNIARQAIAKALGGTSNA